ncbi:MAG: glutamyl-tRNA reductase [Propionibacteriaceae bacterium]|nr:glutamyl-tRNA reductase [Propionibacteriaceae bacterium]
MMKIHTQQSDPSMDECPFFQDHASAPPPALSGVHMLCVGLSHREAQPEELAILADAEREVRDYLTAHIGGEIEGMVVLATCNRFEIYLDANAFHSGVGLAMAAVNEAIPDLGHTLAEAFYCHSGAGAVEHLYRVSAGLESMVVGESEIAGQVKRALKTAGPHISPRLRRAFQGALTSWKAIASQTGLAAVGRSLAAVGLDIAADEATSDGSGLLLPPWADTNVLILGTGQYAGTVVAELTRRGCQHMTVYSASGNATSFAATHPVSVTDDLSTAVHQADLVVAASGSGPAKVDVGILQDSATHVVVDLSGGVDVAPDLPVRVIGLEEIGDHAPPACQDSVDQAEALVMSSVAALLQDELGRGAAPAITAMRSYVTDIIDAELARARSIYPEEVAAAVEWSLHRVSSALLHHPSVAAAELARIGRMAEYHQALETLFGIQVES